MSLFFQRKSVSVQTIRRLPQYLRVLCDWHAYGRELARLRTWPRKPACRRL